MAISAPVRALLVSTALVAPFVGHAAFAQSADRAPVRNTGVLEEVVVTATRRSDIVSRVPLSVTAVSQGAMESKGIRTVDDLSRSIPALSLTSGVTPGVSQIAIRGIVSTIGAATTGVYLDDTPLQKRGGNGIVQNNGAPTPPLFDLERVEVLRGPQGTLYGGSSQGGTIRFITPTPSLTEMSGFARGQVSHTEYGDPSYEFGAAIGGPIVKDKIGFRASAFGRKTGGYIDYLDVYTPGLPIRHDDANDGTTWAVRASLLMVPTERARVTLNIYASQELLNGNNQFYESQGAVAVPTRCYRGTVTVVPCNGTQSYTRQGRTFGPFNVSEFQNLERFVPKGSSTLAVPSVTLDYAFDNMDVKSVTSYVYDRATSTTYDSSVVNTILGGYPPYLPEFPDYHGVFASRNNRNGIVQEVRFSSSNEDSRLNWVGGVYFSNLTTKTHYTNLEDLDRIDMVLFGIDAQARYGLPLLPGGFAAIRDQTLKDTEVAAFGDANFELTEKLKILAGVRFSRVQFDYNQVFYGTLTGWLVPTAANTGIVSGSVEESPITPKFGAQYQLTESNMVYVNAAKGFRPGGVNSPISPSICGVALAATGLTAADIPTTYDSDSVWSYEAGTKFRAFNRRLQVTTSAYMINWTGVQLNVSLGSGCGQTFVSNAGKAVSRGFELETRALLGYGLTADVSVGYTDAEYTESALGPKPISGAAAPVIVIKGQKLPVSPWSLSVGLQYDFKAFGGRTSFIRGDYRYSGEYNRNSAGVPGYLPDVSKAEATHYVSARAGMDFDNWSVNIFALNLLNSDAHLFEVGGRGNCLANAAPCSTYANFNPQIAATSFRPRELGIQATYRY